MIDANSEVFAIKDSNELFRDGVCVALEECPPRLRNLVNPYTEDLGDVCLLFRS